MTTKEYMVVLKDGVNYNQFWNEIETSTNGLIHVPDRAVDIADNLDALDRITHYFLTDQEAELLRQDPRVLGVEIPAEHRDDIQISINGGQLSNFVKTNSSTGTNVNWGLTRHNSTVNVYGNTANVVGVANSQPTYYNYVPNGTNVDVVIIDSGIQANHPEFQNANGVSRVQTTMGNVSLASSLGDYNGHGTHVAGIAAGKNYGWAKNSNIYPIKFVGIPAADPNKGFSGNSFSNIANVIVSWHNSKPINPATGVKNPTVVNMSFQYNISFANTTNSYIANVTYRGNTYLNPSFPNSTYGLYAYQGTYPYWDQTYNAPIDTLTSAGIIVTKSAGNDRLKIDVPGGLDYNNSIWLKYSSNNQPVGNGYYMRGGSPISSNAIVVGALDSTTYNNTSTDKKADYSNAGPGVPIFAAGSNIMSSCSTNDLLGRYANGVSYSIGQTYALDKNTNPAFKQVNIPGTSMAAPQIAGIAALYLQGNPTATPANVKSWILNNSTGTMIGNIATNPSGTDYGNANSQWGGNAGVAYQALRGIPYIKDPSTGSWKSVKAVFVKQNNTWVEVKKKWVNQNGNWVEVA